MFQKTKLFCGRSMLEMLGVLAIIGMLSLTALFGYRMAITYHRANETMSDVMLRATNVQTRENFASFTGTEFTFPDMGDYKTKNTLGYAVHTYPEGEDAEYAFRVEVSSVPFDVCKRINNMNPTAVDEIEPVASNCGDTTTTMKFYFGDKLGGDFPIPPGPGPEPDLDPIECTTPCGECQVCINGACQNRTNGMTCSSGCCKNGTCGDCGIANCSKNEECSAGLCCKSGVCTNCSPDCPTTRCALCQIEVGADANGCPICETDPDECCGLSGSAEQCCRNGLSCEKCETKNYNTCSCVPKYSAERPSECSVLDEETCSWIETCQENSSCVNGACECNKGFVLADDAKTCCPTDKPILDPETKACIACLNDADCIGEGADYNPCMRCVAGDGGNTCQMSGTLWRNGSDGELQCCQSENGSGGYNTAYYSDFKFDGCDDVCFSGQANTISIKGKDYFVGNSCCPSTSANEGGVCGAACTAGTMGIPETKWDGSWSCCGFDSHVCPVTGSGLADKPQTKCCPLTDEAYWNYQSQSAECCPNSFGENTLNNVYNVKGKTGVWHCCPTSEKAYWNGVAVGCCSGSLYTSAYQEGLEVYNCCDTTDGLYAVAEVMGSSQSGIGNLETCCSTSVYGQNPSAYWDGNKAQCCSGTVYKDVNGYSCCPSDSVVTDVVGATDGLQTCCSVSAYGNEPSAWWYEASNELFDSYAVCCQTGVEATAYGCCDLTTMENNKDLCRACGYRWEKSAVYYLSGETCDRTNYRCGGNQYCQDRYGSGSEWCSLGGLNCNMDAWGCFVEGQTMCSTPAGCSLAKEPCTTE